jgi:hypothetical protein
VLSRIGWWRKAWRTITPGLATGKSVPRWSNFASRENLISPMGQQTRMNLSRIFGEIVDRQ